MQSSTARTQTQTGRQTPQFLGSDIVWFGGYKSHNLCFWLFSSSRNRTELFCDLLNLFQHFSVQVPWGFLSVRPHCLRNWDELFFPFQSAWCGFLFLALLTCPELLVPKWAETETGARAETASPFLEWTRPVTSVPALPFFYLILRIQPKTSCLQENLDPVCQNC